jgi:GntR family transcriptional regulator, transcriptional repressor for pyruvate dehydrogenase complex
MTEHLAAPTAGRRDSQTNRVAQALLERLRDGTYPVGTRIPSERVLAGEFAVSRPVVREALSTLSGLDLLDIQMGRGAFVTSTATNDTNTPTANLQDVVNVREILETGALRLAGTQSRVTDTEPVVAALRDLGAAVSRRTQTAELDRRLHTAIIESSGSGLLISLWESLEQQIHDTIRISPHGAVMSSDIFALHEKLAAGLLGGDMDESIAASRELHDQNREFLRSLLG